jgi:hypothetical protein
MAANIKHLKMKSRITIEVDFDNGNQPTIVLSLLRSDDVRDKLLSSFIEKFSHQRAWCKAYYAGENMNGKQFHIVPIEPKDLKEEASLMNLLSSECFPTKGETMQARNEPQKDENGTPRRNQLHKFTAGEIQLYEVMQSIEKIGAHPLLTEVVNALSEARERLADWVELPNPISYDK